MASMKEFKAQGKQCPNCGSTKHVYCTQSPEPEVDPNSVEQKLLDTIFGVRRKENA